MKKTLLSGLLAIGTFIVACGQAGTANGGGNYSLNVPLSEDENDFMAYLVDYDSGEKIDSVVVAGEKAVFNGTVDKPVLARLLVENQRLGSFILEPGTLTFNNADGSATIEGSALNARFDKIGEEMNAIVKEFRALPQDSLYEQRSAELQARYAKVEDDALKQNLDNPIGYYFFVNRAFNMDRAELDEALKQYPQFASSKRIASLKKTMQLKEETSPGHKFKDFEVTYEGKTSRLSDYVGRGKWVLVDFWASWCGPCIRQTAVIKDILKEYGPKGLEVLGVAVWDEPAATLEGIKTHQLPWPQIIGAGTIPTDLYGISGIPCIILFDPEGNIISRDKQDDELRAEVAAAFAK